MHYAVMQGNLLFKGAGDACSALIAGKLLFVWGIII